MQLSVVPNEFWNIYCFFLTTLTECLDGYFGRYCTPCIYPSYGYLCRFTCTCLQHLCHNVHGCQGKWFTCTVCPKIFLQHIVAIFNKNAYICTRRAIEIDQEEKYPRSKISLLIHYRFSIEKNHRNENRFLTSIYSGEC